VHHGEVHDDGELLSIGAFARASRLSMKALRLYERLGLLTPAVVDQRNGYRRYRENQLFTARLIVSLRRLDMPLQEIGRIINAHGEVGAELLAEYWAKVEERIAVQRGLADLLRTSLRGGDARFGALDIRRRMVPDQLVLTEQRSIQHLTELERWTAATMDRLTSATTVTGHPFVIIHGEINEDSDGPVEVCVPVPEATASRVEKAHEEVYVRLTKAQFDYPQILGAYETLERWIAQNRLHLAGSPREIYVREFRKFAEMQNAEPAAEIAEVAFPIA
jgi:DNA-binding transcriptional MerR regulator